MCVQVCVRGNRCDTVGELRLAVPCEIVRDPCYDNLVRKPLPQEHQCLCGVDVAATLQAAGVEYEQDDCGDWHVTGEAK